MKIKNIRKKEESGVEIPREVNYLIAFLKQVENNTSDVDRWRNSSAIIIQRCFRENKCVFPIFSSYHRIIQSRLNFHWIFSFFSIEFLTNEIFCNFLVFLSSPRPYLLFQSESTLFLLFFLFMRPANSIFGLFCLNRSFFFSIFRTRPSRSLVTIFQKTRLSLSRHCSNNITST